MNKKIKKFNFNKVIKYELPNDRLAGVQEPTGTRSHHKYPW